MLVSYRPKKGREGRLLSLLRRHGPALESEGLLAGVARLLRARGKRDGRVHFVETFEWRDELASGRAHETPAVRAIWEAMEPLLESMELSLVEAVPQAGKRKRPPSGPRHAAAARPSRRRR